VRTYLFGLDDEKHVIDGEGIAAFIKPLLRSQLRTG